MPCNRACLVVPAFATSTPPDPHTACHSDSCPTYDGDPAYFTEKWRSPERGSGGVLSEKMRCRVEKNIILPKRTMRSGTRLEYLKYTVRPPRKGMSARFPARLSSIAMGGARISGLNTVEMTFEKSIRSSRPISGQTSWRRYQGDCASRRSRAAAHHCPH